MKRIELDTKGFKIDQTKLEKYADTAKKNLARLRSGQDAYTGWVNLPSEFDEKLLKEIEDTADEVSRSCSLFVVIGIGGSFLGAKAVIEALGGKKEGSPEVVFAGTDLSGSQLDRIMQRIKNENSMICVISKSGSTAETLLTFSILKDAIIEKYGKEESVHRIIAVTDIEKGLLREEVQKTGWRSFVVPDDIGGRYSVLSAVGLLPIAVAGYDIRQLLCGAAEMASDPRWDGKLLNYAANRVAMQDEGKGLEVFASFEERMNYFGLWLMQLFGETEGKQGLGGFPVFLHFTRDLHSMGQFIQQGRPIFWETIIKLGTKPVDIKIPDSAGSLYAGKTLEQINDCALMGVSKAHQNAGVSVGIVEIPALDEKSIGQFIYFFEVSAALSGYGLGIDPFDQPGVEAYKSEMRKLIAEL